MRNNQPSPLINFHEDGIIIKKSDKYFLNCKEIKQKFLHKHFGKYDHHGFEEGISICLIDKRQSSYPRKRETLMDENP